jgi:hypothetical protein
VTASSSSSGKQAECLATVWPINSDATWLGGREGSRSVLRLLYMSTFSASKTLRGQVVAALCCAAQECEDVVRDVCR